MKKTTIMTVFLFLIAVMPVWANQPFPYCTSFEGFYDGEVAGQFDWTSSNESTVVISEYASENGLGVNTPDGDKYCRLGSSNGWMQGAYSPTIDGSPISDGMWWIEITARVGQQNTTGSTYFQISGINGNILYRMGLYNSGHIYCNDVDTGVSFVRGQWYRLRIEVNQVIGQSTPHRARFFLNGNQIVEHNAFSFGNGLGFYYLYGGANGGGWPAGDIYSYFDNIRMGSGPYVDDRLPGDANADGMVDVGDLGILAANYGMTSGASWGQGDFNGDGAVDVGDLGILAAHYGEGSSEATNFNADYAKAFGLTATTDKIENKEDSSSACSMMALPLISGFLLAGLGLGRFKFKFPIIIALGVVVLGWSSISFAEDIRCYPTDGSVMLEAEYPYSTNFLYGPQVDSSEAEDCLGRGYLNLNVFDLPTDGQPWQAKYVFFVPEDARYHLWVLDQQNAGTMRWSVDGSAFTNRRITGTIPAGFPSARSLGMEKWYRLTQESGLFLKKSQNPHKLVIEVQPGEANRACYYIDAIALMPIAQAPRGWVREIGLATTDYTVRFNLNFAEAYKVIPVSPSAKVAGDYMPNSQLWNQSPCIETFTARGQAQPMSLVIYAKENLGSVNVSVSPFVSEGGQTLPAADVRLVRVWKQRKSYESTVSGDPFSELLEPATAVTLLENTFRQIWITVTPSIGASPGYYNATLTITPTDAPAMAIPLKIRVMPFRLQEPTNKTLGIFYYGRSGNWWEFNPNKTIEHYDNDFRDMKNHGVRALFFCDTPDYVVRQNGSLKVYSGFNRTTTPTSVQQQRYSQLAEGQVAIDLDSFMNVVNLINYHGLDRYLIQYQSLKKPIGIITNTPESELGWHGRAEVGSNFIDLLTRSVQGIDQAVASRSYNPIRYCMDDEVYWGGEYRMSGYMNLANIVKNAGGKQSVTMSYTQASDELLQLRSVLDLPVGNGPYLKVVQENTGVWQDRLGSYTQIWSPDYEGTRLRAGLQFWAFPYTTFFGHAYQASVGDSYDDMDGTVPDMNATYPDPVTGQPIPTVQWEGFRQGFYDMCYLQTLKNRIQALSEGSASRQVCQQAWDQIQQIFQSYADSDSSFDSLSGMPSDEMDRIRALAADALSRSYP
jgi:hypothetical protein